MAVFLARIIEFLCLAIHQVLMYFTALMIFTLIGFYYFIYVLWTGGFEGVVNSPFLAGAFYIVIILTCSVLLFMTTGMGEKLLRMFFIMRKPTMREEQKLDAAFDKVKTAYREKYGAEIKLTPFIIDSPYLNGLALGKSTIGLNSGVVEDAEVDEIAAVIAHEAGHIHHGDGLYNSLFFGAGSHLRAMSLLFRGGKESQPKEYGLKGILFFPFAIVAIVSAPLFWIMGLTNKLVHWKIEYRADNFADNLGFGDSLIVFLERLQAMDVREDHGFMKIYNYSHPPVRTRIDTIERRRAQA